MIILQYLKDGLLSIDKCDVIAKDKLWCVYFGLILKLAWPMQIYEVSLSRIEKMECLISKFSEEFKLSKAHNFSKCCVTPWTHL